LAGAGTKTPDKLIGDEELITLLKKCADERAELLKKAQVSTFKCSLCIISFNFCVNYTCLIFTEAYLIKLLQCCVVLWYCIKYHGAATALLEALQPVHSQNRIL